MGIEVILGVVKETGTILFPPLLFRRVCISYNDLFF